MTIPGGSLAINSSKLRSRWQWSVVWLQSGALGSILPTSRLRASPTIGETLPVVAAAMIAQADVERHRVVYMFNDTRLLVSPGDRYADVDRQLEGGWRRRADWLARQSRRHP